MWLWVRGESVSERIVRGPSGRGGRLVVVTAGPRGSRYRFDGFTSDELSVTTSAVPVVGGTVTAFEQSPV